MKQLLLFSMLLFIILPCHSQSGKAKDIERIAFEWAGANNRHDIQTLEQMYAPTVLFYGKSKDVSTCINEKAVFFKANAYTISISDVDIDFYKNGTVKCNFNKEESWKGVARKDQAYLLLEKRGGKYLINGESDQRMDSKLGIDLQLGDKNYNRNGLLYILIGTTIGLLITWGAIYFFRRNRKVPMLFSQSITNEKEVALPVFPAEELKKNHGLAFEQCVVKKFDKNYFKLLNWRGDKYIDGHYPLSSLDPDLDYLYGDSARQQRFSIECKWRSGYTNNCVDLGQKRKIDRYRQYSKEQGCPVFIVLGLGGEGSQPEKMFIIPLDDIKSPIISRQELDKYYRYRKDNFFLDISALRLQ